MEGFAGKLAARTVAQSVENAALLALAFCNSHQLAAQDLVQYEKLEQWNVGQPEEVLASESEDVARLREGVTEQVQSTSVRCCV